MVAAAALVLMTGLLLCSRKTTCIIQDRDRILIHTTAEKEPLAILEEAGIRLGSQDRLKLEENEDGPVLQVLRQQKITVDYYGQVQEVVSYGETVAQLLERLELTVGEGDKISLPPEQKTSDGMVLRISRHFQQEQIYTVTMPCETVYCSDPALPAGVQRVLIQGQNGELLRHADVTYTNGQETGRDITSEEVLIQPVSTLVAVGTGLKQVEADEALPVIRDGLIYLPTGEVLTYSKVISSLATAYCDKGKTATGTQARVGAIAVDPEVIPYGTRMFILTKDGEYIYGIATAEDCGSKKFIYGTRIDLHYDTEYECRQFGARMCWVYFLS